MKFRNKISLLFTLLTATLLLCLSVFIYLYSLRSTHTHFFTRLKVRSSLALEAALGEESNTALQVKELRELFLPTLPLEHDYFITYDSLQDRWQQIDTLNLPLSFYKELSNKGAAEYENRFHYYAGFRKDEIAGRAAIAYAYNEEGDEQMQSLQNILLFGFTLSCIIVFVMGRLFAQQVIKPVADIASEVNDLNASNMDKRLPVPKGDDEITSLVHTYNSMLDRLQTAFQLQSNFISNASHELRTPLTAILGEADVILSGERRNDEYKKSIESIRDDAQKLNELVDSLLKLSQVGFDGKKQMLEEVSIDMLLMSIKGHLNKRFPDNKVRIMAKDMPEDPDALVLTCIASWIELAFLNIISNAIKYSNNKEVLVTLSGTNEELNVSIYDSGIGISKDDLQHVFELFFRGSNSLTYAGHGIGLPLADKIIRLHGGQIRIESEYEKGTCVTVNFRKNLIRK